MYLKSERNDRSNTMVDTLVLFLMWSGSLSLWFLSPTFWKQVHAPMWLVLSGTMGVLSHIYLKNRRDEEIWQFAEQERHAEALRGNPYDAGRTRFRIVPYYLSMVCRVPIYLLGVKSFLPEIWKQELRTLSCVNVIGMVIVIVVMCSVLEWFFHKNFMHKNLFGPPLARTSHDIVHHGISSRDGYNIPDDVETSLSGVFPLLMPEGFLLFFVVLFLLAKHLEGTADVPLFLVGILVGQAYQVVYETLHAGDHGMETARIPGMIGALLEEQAEHHELHHLARHTNFNVVLPWADRLFSTWSALKGGAKRKTIDTLEVGDAYYSVPGKVASFFSKIGKRTTPFWDNHPVLFRRSLAEMKVQARVIKERVRLRILKKKESE